jgi:hypothetical protein
MEASILTVSFDTPISQDVFHPEEFDLVAVISQFSEFRDDSDSDIDEEVLKNVDLDDSLLLEIQIQASAISSKLTFFSSLQQVMSPVLR